MERDVVVDGSRRGGHDVRTRALPAANPLLTLVAALALIASAALSATVGAAIAHASTPYECSGMGSAGPLPEGSQTISGTVTDALGPLEGMAVSLRATAGGLETTSTNPLGEYAFPGLGDGDYTVAVEDFSGTYMNGFFAGVGVAPVPAEADATIVSINGSGAAGVDVALQPESLHTISGSVSDSNGDPVAGASLEARGAYFGDLLSCVIADDGTFTAIDVRVGVYLLRVSADGYPIGYFKAGAPGNFTTHFSDASLVTVDTDLSVIDIAFPEVFTLQGVVLDGADQPVEGIYVQADETDPGATGYAPSASDGTFTIEGLPAGEYEISYSDGNGLYFSGWYGGDGVRSPNQAGAVAVTVPRVDPPIELLAELAPTMTGRITNEDGDGVADAALTICDADEVACATSSGTDADGYFTAHVVTPADYYVMVQPAEPETYPTGGFIQSLDGPIGPGRENALVIPAGVTDVTGVNGVLPFGGRIGGTLTAGGSPVAFDIVSLCVSEVECSSGADTDENGDFLSPALFVGTYYAQAHNPDYSTFYWYVEGAAASTDFADATPITVTVGAVETIAMDIPASGVPTTPENPDITLDDGNGNSIDMSFAGIDEGGVTSVSTSETGIDPPAGFQLGAPATYYDFVTTATGWESVQICIPYGGVSYLSESGLRLFHYDDDVGAWEDITDPGYPDLGTQTICGTTDSLSPFVLAERSMAFTGFHGPKAPPIFNEVKAGSTIGLTFGLGGDFGLSIFAEGSPSMAQVSCTSGAPIGGPDATVASLKYSAKKDQYTLQIATSKSWKNTCRAISVELIDGTVATVWYHLKP
jgi:hypothetical protein